MNQVYQQQLVHQQQQAEQLRAMKVSETDLHYSILIFFDKLYFFFE